MNQNEISKLSFILQLEKLKHEIHKHCTTNDALMTQHFLNAMHYSDGGILLANIIAFDLSMIQEMTIDVLRCVFIFIQLIPIYIELV